MILLTIKKSQPGFYDLCLQDGHPPLGWSDTAAYLVLPVLLVVSQYVSMEIMKPPQVKTHLKFVCCLIDHFKPLDGF